MLTACGNHVTIHTHTHMSLYIYKHIYNHLIIHLKYVQFLFVTYTSIKLKKHQEIKAPLMAPHSSTLAWKIPRTEEPGRLQSMGS